MRWRLSFFIGLIPLVVLTLSAAASAVFGLQLIANDELLFGSIALVCSLGFGLFAVVGSRLWERRK